jgi:hypothetical protein
LSTSKEASSVIPSLAQAGFDTTLEPSAAVAALRSIRDRRAAPEADIARALGSIVAPESAAMLAEMEQAASGELRRWIRRAGFKLHQRGIDAPPRSKADAARPSAESGLTALLSPIDREGVRIVWILKRRASGGISRLWAVESESEGLLGARVASLSRKELKTEREEIERRAGMKMVDADPELADFIVCEAYRRTSPELRARVGDFLALRSELTGASVPPEIQHPIYRELGGALAEDPSPELLREPELLEWRIAPEAIASYLAEINRAGESLIVVSPIQQRDRANEVIERAIKELLSGESGARIRRRLEDLAYYMARDGRMQQAAWAASAAARLRYGAIPRKVPFFDALIRTQLGTQVAAQEQHAASEARLIMTPAEAMRAQQEARTRRGRG